MNHSAKRINFLAQRNCGKRYLEIGVLDGLTFFAVTLPHKVAVDPNFRFSPMEHGAPDSYFFSMTSDDFFDGLLSSSIKLPSLSGLTASNEMDRPFFDIVFIDGLHTFEQSFKDFKNSLQFSNENTIWILDDTVPCDPYSALPVQDKCLAIRERAGLLGDAWHGDVFKTIFALHDMYPEFSYCTVMEDNPQTIIWKGPVSARKKFFTSLDEISHLDYFAMLECAHLLMPVDSDLLPQLIGSSIDPLSNATPNAWEKLIYCQLVSKNISQQTQSQIDMLQGTIKDLRHIAKIQKEELSKIRNHR
jgi:hypothetical protein